MKAWLLGSVVLLGAFLVPMKTEGQQVKCEKCRDEYYLEGEEMQVKHRFDSTGQSMRECQGLGEALSELVAEASRHSGPALKHEDCADCHNDWSHGSSCIDPPHGPCWTEEYPVDYVSDAVDRTVKALGSENSELDATVADALAAVLARVNTLTADRTSGTLRLSDCAGRVLAEWPLLAALEKKISESR